MSFIAVAIGLTIAGASVAAYGQYQAGKQAQQQAKAQAAWHAYNAKVAQREKEAQDAANLFASRQEKKKANALLAKQRAMIGASGVEMEGSPLLVAEDTAAELAKEQQQLRLTGQRKSMAWKNQSILDMSKASAANAAAAGYGRAAIWGAAGTSIQGAGTAAYMKYMAGRGGGGSSGSSGISVSAGYGSGFDYGAGSGFLD